MNKLDFDWSQHGGNSVGALISADRKLLVGDIGTLNYLKNMILVSRGNSENGPGYYQFGSHAYIGRGQALSLNITNEEDYDVLQQLLPENILERTSVDGKETYKRLGYPFTPFCEHTNESAMEVNVNQIKIAGKGQSAKLQDAHAFRYDFESYEDVKGQVMVMSGGVTTNDPKVERVNIRCYSPANGPMSD